MVRNDKPESILFICEEPLDTQASSQHLFNMYLKLFFAHMPGDTKVFIFHPEISAEGPYYLIKNKSLDRFNILYTKIPPRYSMFKESFLNEKMDAVFKEIINEHAFDVIHMFGLKNHSMSYPFIAKQHNIPFIFSVTNHLLLSPFIFGYSPDNPASKKDITKVSLVNFVGTPFFRIYEKIRSLLSPSENRSVYWFEQKGRYSRAYNADNSDHKKITDESKLERRKAVSEFVDFTDTFHFFSSFIYNTMYRTAIPEKKVVICSQGADKMWKNEARPFEINSSLSFTFIGDILPEEGVEELIEAFNILNEMGLPNMLNIYGEVCENRAYFKKLKKNVRSSNIIFNGPVCMDRINAVLKPSHVFIQPRKWYSDEIFLSLKAMTLRKAVITSRYSSAGELVRKNNRGLLLNEISAPSIVKAVTELESNRKRLYFFMRDASEVKFPLMENNISFFMKLYREKIAGNPLRQTSKTSRNISKKRKKRSRETE